MRLYQSNRLENLLGLLCDNLNAQVADPLVPEVIVVQNQGMAQWVSQQLALHTGIAANLHFPLPGRCVWDLFDKLGGAPPQEDLFQAAVLKWRIFGLLPKLIDLPDFVEPAAYVAGDRDGTRLAQLSGKIADVFDQYQVYRPDMLEDWEQGRTTPNSSAVWQAELWRRLCADTTSVRAGLFRRFAELLAAPSAAVVLPPRLHLFGLNGLAPVYLEIFAQVGRIIPVDLYHLSPSLEFWEDLVSAREQARRRGRGQEISEDQYYEEGHPLLASLGRTGQEFARQLQDYEVEEADAYDPGPGTRLLGMVQNRILDFHDRAAGDDLFTLLPDDRSIQLHCCHSPLREIQVLHDRLLDLFMASPDLTPGDILVSAPDISRYADAIAGVFGEAPPERRIPWSMTDQTLSGQYAQVGSFLAVLALLESRFTGAEVLALCENELILARFGLNPAQLPRLHTWVAESGIRWGLDTRHRQSLEVEAGDLFSWRFGLDRLLLGYLLGGDEETFGGVVPYAALETGEAQALGGFAALVATLSRWQRQIGRVRTPQEWSEDLLQLLTDLWDDAAEDAGITRVQGVITGLRTDCHLAGINTPLSFGVVRNYLQERLSAAESGQPFISGRVIFCNMVPMRSVPFRVICLLGLSDQDFPRSQRPLSFDLMAAQPRPGDRNRRNDDRYLFLEALLSAREVLYLSWVGRSQRDESKRPPSVVVAELQDYLDRSCVPPPGAEKVSEWIITVHPMQPFSRHCFDGTPGTASYNRAWLPNVEEGAASPFLTTPLAVDKEEARAVDWARLLAFWGDPIKFFLERRLGVRLQNRQTSLEECEPFQLDHLESYFVRTDVTCDQLEGRDDAAIRKRLTGSGLLPQAGFGRLQFAQILSGATDIATHLKALPSKWSTPLPPLEIDREIGRFHVTGWLHDIVSGGRLAWRAGRMRGPDLLALWINHLGLNLLQPEGVGRESKLYCWDKSEGVQHWHLPPLGAEDAEKHLLQLFTWYAAGLAQPLPFFPKTTFAWAEAKKEKKDQEARKAWFPQCRQDGSSSQGEGEQEMYRLFFAQDTLPVSPDFEELAALFTPIFAQLVEEKDDAAA